MYHGKLNKLNKQWKNILFGFCSHENRGEIQNFKNIGSGPPITKHLRIRFLNGYQKVLEQKF